MGQLRMVVGRANTKKSAIMVERLHQCMQRGEHGLYIVPEQYTFEAERAMAHTFSGLLGVEVTSFSRLFERILSQSGKTLPYLSKQGRNMVVRRAICHRQKELIMYSSVAQKPDFANRIDLIISQFKQSGIGPKELLESLKKLDEGSLLYQKLHDIQLLFEASEDYLKSRYLTANDVQRVATDRLKDSFVRNCHVFIDGFDNPSNELYAFINELLLCAKSVTITLRIDVERDDALFAPDFRAMGRLKELAQRNGIPIKTEFCRSNKPDTALNHLERNFHSSQTACFYGDADEIKIFTLADRRAEAEYLADSVIERAQQGVRYRDMAVVCPDLELYGSLVKRAFEKRGIPLFFDAKKPISGQAAASFVLNSIRAATGGYNVGNVLSVIKSGYLDVDRADAEIFENYLLRYGIYGSSLTAPLTFGEIPEAAERVRLCTMSNLVRLHDDLKDVDATKKSQAVLHYLESVSLKDKLTSEAERLLSEGRETEAQILSQLYSTFEELFNQIIVILGDSPLSMTEFSTLVEEGIASYSIGSVPSNADQIMLGDVQRSKLKRVDTLFVIGCNEGLLPRTPDSGTLLNDADLRHMSSCGLTVWSDSMAQMQNDRLELYSLLTKADKRLQLSFACSAEGATLTPSQLIGHILELFPQVRIQSSLEDFSKLPVCIQSGFSRLVSEYRPIGQGRAHKALLPALIRVYSSRPEYSDKLKRILSGAVCCNSPSPLIKPVAAALYGDVTRMSASRLELFNKCPFSHFASYGLKAEPRKEAKEEVSDIGTFIHDALDAFVRHIQDSGLDWATLDFSAADKIVDELLPDRVSAHNDGIFINNVRLRESLFLLEIRIKLACRSIVRQVQLGAFRPAVTELDFGFGGDFPAVTLVTDSGRKIYLRGKIDRVDSAETGDERLLRVVDYKLGDRRLEPERIESGETLQLPLYLEAAKALEGEGVAMYYMPMGQKIPDEEPNEEQIHSLYGLTADDEAVLTASETEKSDSSRYLSGIKYKKDGVSGAVCSRAELNRIVTLAKHVAARTVERMYEGISEVFPTAKACTYCKYKSVCRFDKQLGGKLRAVAKKDIKELSEEVLV